MANRWNYFNKQEGTLKIVTAIMQHPGEDEYPRMLEVFKYSVKKHMPHAALEVLEFDPVMSVGAGQHMADNRQKMEAWARTAIDEPTIFMDCDTMLLGDLSKAFEYDFDIGITARTSGDPPYNGGVVFARPTAAARQFMMIWNRWDYELYGNREAYQKYIDKYYGQNQAALGYILEQGIVEHVTFKSFPCSVWNACKEDWPKLRKNVKVLHIKSRLRSYALSEERLETVPLDLYEAAYFWRKYERKANYGQ
jgi:hypothetical protein